MKSVSLFIILFTVISLGISSQTYAQTGSSTRNSGLEKGALPPKKEKKYKYIIILDTQNTLYGNKCAMQVTHRFGFEYLPMPKSQLKTERESSIMFHNLFTTLSISLTRGPWWKIVLKKRLKECQRKSRDMNG